MFFDHFPHFELHLYSVGPMPTNCYFLTEKNSRHTLIVDPGDEGDFLSETVLQLQLAPQALFFTHGHCDHVCGALPLFLNFATRQQSLPVWLDSKDIFLYQRAQKTALHFGATTCDPILPLSQIQAPSQASITDLFSSSSCQILATPGHTPGSLVLYFPEDRIAFVGDLIFADGSRGRTDFSYGNAKKLSYSLSLLKKTLHPDTLICPGHGEPFTLANVL